MSKEGSLGNGDTFKMMMSINFDQPIIQEVTFEDSDDDDTRKLELHLKQELIGETIHSENILKLGAKRKTFTIQQTMPEKHNETTDEEYVLENNKSGENATPAEVLAFSFEQIDEIILSSEDETSSNAPEESTRQKIAKQTTIHNNGTDHSNINTIESFNSDDANSNSVTLQVKEVRTISLSEWKDQGCSEHQEAQPVSNYSSLTDINIESIANANPVSAPPFVSEINCSPTTNNDIFKRMLTTVVKNMFMILPALNKYVKSISKDIETKKNIIKGEFEKVKYHYFFMSYSLVASTLLPLKNNEQTIKKIILAIKIYANSKGEKTSEHNIEILCKELFQWTEQQKNWISQNTTRQTTFGQPISQNEERLPNYQTRYQTIKRRQTQDNSEPVLNEMRRNSNAYINASTVNEQHPLITSLLYSKPNPNIIFNDNMSKRKDCSCNLCKPKAQSYKPSCPNGHDQTTEKVYKNQETAIQKRVNKLNALSCTSIDLSPPPTYNPHARAQLQFISQKREDLGPLTQTLISPPTEAPGVFEQQTSQNRYPVIVNATSMSQPPSYSNLSWYCQVCLQPASLRCLGCNFIHYCSELCRVKGQKLNQCHLRPTERS